MTDLFDGLEQVLLVGGVGRDAAMAAQLQRRHEHAHGVLLVLGEALLVVVQQLVQVQRQLGAVLGGERRRRLKLNSCPEQSGEDRKQASSC